MPIGLPLIISSNELAASDHIEIECEQTGEKHISQLFVVVRKMCMEKH